jgi:L-idonate 5-dehydrogenase
LAALEDGLDVTWLITHRYPISEAAQAITVAADRNSGSGKVLLKLGGG